MEALMKFKVICPVHRNHDVEGVCPRCKANMEITILILKCPKCGNYGVFEIENFTGNHKK
jgi:Zn finger protein HypA/HybF involved in hydrogenase expression